MEKDKEGTDQLKMVTCASKSLTSAQKNYSTFEYLAIVWAILLTNYKALEGIFEKALFDLASLCLHWNCVEGTGKEIGESEDLPSIGCGDFFVASL